MSKSAFRKYLRIVASAFPPTALLVADWDSLRYRCEALEDRCRHLEAAKGESDRPMLERARSNFALGAAESKNLPDPGARWEMYSARARGFMPHFSDPADAILFAQEPAAHGGFETRDSRDLLPAIAEAEEKGLAAKYPAFVDSLSFWSESIYADPESTVQYKGRPVSAPLYLEISHCLFCFDHLPKAPRTVCEIGGGYGGPARVWLTNPVHRPAKYIIVDLPESLFFSELYLAKHFGVEEVFYVSDRSAATAERIGRARIVLCPNGFIDMLAPFDIDLVINTNSLQEMPEAYIDFFMRWIDRQSCEFFFSRNFALQDLCDLRESMNTWSPRPSAKWKTHFLEHHNDRERPTQTTLYQRSEHDAAQRQAAAVPTIEKLLNGPLTNQTLAELVDLIRLGMNETQILLLLRKIAAYPFVPKEAWYLVTWLATHGTHAFLSENRKEISAMKKALDRLHEKL